jgi:putative endonuclease
MAFTYIVQCNDGSYYVGSTIDLERRISQHNLGLGAAYTRRRRPVRLVWAVEFSSIRTAYEFEKQVQGWGRAKREALIEGRLEDLPALARTARRVVVSASSTGDTQPARPVEAASTSSIDSQPTGPVTAVSTGSTDGGGHEGTTRSAGS